MKKTLLLAFVCAALVACGKDDPIDLPQPAPKPAPEQQKEPSNPEQSGTEQSGGEEPNTGNPGDTPDKQEPAPAVTVEDITAYFGFDRLKDVNVALVLISEQKGARQINGKTINVTKAEMKSKDEQAGSFVLLVAGKVAEKDFETTLTFEGFAKRPGNYNMGKRVHGEWKKGVDKYAKFDLDCLLREKNTDKFTAKYLSEMIDFYASDYDGKPFYYTEEDIEKTVISGIEYKSYNGGEISFYLTYEGVKRDNPIRLGIDKNIYYSRKVTVNPNFAKDKYVRGVKENYAIFGGDAVEYNEDFYVVQCMGGKNAEESAGKLNFEFSLMPAKGDGEPLATFSKEIEGFKKLKDLKGELFPQFTSEVQEVMKKYIKADMPAGDVTNLIKTPIDTWIKKVSFSVKRGGRYYDIYWHDNFTVLKGEDHPVMDVYLERPKFELVSATLKDGHPRMLELRIKLISANETSLDDDNIILTLGVHIPLV